MICNLVISAETTKTQYQFQYRNYYDNSTNAYDDLISALWKTFSMLGIEYYGDMVSKFDKIDKYYS